MSPQHTPNVRALSVMLAVPNDMEDIHDYQMPGGIHRQGRFIDPFGHLWLAGNTSPLSRFPLEARQLREGGVP